MAGRHIARRRREWRHACLKAGASVLALGAGAALVIAPPARAADTSFDAVAAAYGINNGISNPSLPLNLVLTGSGPASSAHLTSLGGSDAFASFPYPGDTIVGAPGLMSGLFGVSLPNYPLYVATSAGDEPEVANYPGIALNSRSDSLVSESRALVGSDVSGFDSTARIAVDAANGVTAQALTVFKTVDFGQVFSLSGVRSLAKVVADGVSGELTRTSELSIGAINVPGLRLVIPKQTPGTVPLPIPVPGFGQVPPLEFPPMPIPEGGQTLEAPTLGFTNGVFTVRLPGQDRQQYAVPSQPVIKAFADRGITVTFQQAQETKNGVLAPAVTFATDFPAMPENPYYNGATHASYTLGGSFSEVAFDVVEPAPALGGADSGAGVGTAADTPAVLPAEVAALPDVAPGLPAVASDAVDLTLTQTSGQPRLETAQRANFVALRSSALTADTQTIYLAVVAVAIAVFVAGAGIRRLGVLRSWT